MKKRLGGTGELEIHLRSSQVPPIKTALFRFGKLLTMKLGSTKVIPLCILFFVYFASVTNRFNSSQTNKKDHKFLSTFLKNLFGFFMENSNAFGTTHRLLFSRQAG